MKAYTIYALAVLGLWTAATLRGWDLGVQKRGFIPASVRQAPGGYRSFNNWRGGK
jgi:hypothetical protein